ncbi:TPA: hypothetical protein L6J17_002367 [Salmonella enterica subsp. enterica serovar Infantis]|nr:hypothetical protein [Salmonella enterica subsp. enterica serovar Infantis]
MGRFSQGAFELLRTLILRDAANAVGADTNFNTMLNTYDATGNLRWAWGPYKGGWDVHSYDQNGAWRNNPLHIDYRTSEVSVSCNFHVAGAMVATDGNIYGTRWNANGAWLWDTIAEQLAIRDNNINARATVDWVRQNFLSGFRLGAVENAQVWRAYGYNDTPPYVITGVINGNTDDLIDNVTRRPLQMYINGWRNVDWL